MMANANTLSAKTGQWWAEKGGPGMGWSGKQEGRSYGGRGCADTGGGEHKGGGRCGEGTMQKVDRKELTWHLRRLTPMPQFLFPPLLCTTVCGPPPSSPPFPVALPFMPTLSLRTAPFLCSAGPHIS